MALPDTRYLGSTGVKVSPLCLGTMSFGDAADRETAGAIFRRCRAAGINTFDCANVYADGRSEEILGDLIADCRDEVVITTKAHSTGDDPNARGAHRYHLVRAVENSLRRLGTDRIDVFFVHRFDEQTALDETLRALDDLVRQGKVLYLGASNYAAWQVMKALGRQQAEGWTPFHVLQPITYNLAKRQAEVELLPMAQSEELGVLSYSPLGGGLLTGKYGVDERPDDGRLVENPMYQTRYGARQHYEVADRFSTFAQDHGYDPVALAVAWVAHHPAITAPIIGGRNVKQIEGSLGALDIEMTDALYSEISALAPTPPPATDRTEERSEHTYGSR